MKLRELYSQETNLNIISKINSTITEIGARLPGFGLRRSPVGILTVFWTLVWVSIISSTTYLTAELLDIPTNIILESWTSLSIDIQSILVTPVGIATSIAILYGLSIYINTEYGRGTKQEYADKSVGTQSVILSLLITGVGGYMFYIGFITEGFAVALLGTLLSTHYTKKTTLYDRYTEYEHYDLHYINAIVRSLTLWSIVYAFTGGISVITMIPLFINSVYILTFLIRRNYTENLADIYDNETDGFREKLRDDKLFYKHLIDVLKSEGVSIEETEQNNYDMGTDKTMNLYTHMPSRNTTTTSSPPSEITYEDKVNGTVEPAVAVDPMVINDLEWKLEEVFDEYEGTEMYETLKLSDFDLDNLYKKDKTYFKFVHVTLFAIELHSDPQLHSISVVQDALDLSRKVLRELEISIDEVEESALKG